MTIYSLPLLLFRVDLMLRPVHIFWVLTRSFPCKILSPICQSVPG